MKPNLEDAGLGRNPRGELLLGGVPAVELAKRYGTPLHIIDEDRLRARAHGFRNAFTEAYPGTTHVHYAMKANSLPGVVKLIREEGLRVETGTPFEYRLARELGWSPQEIIINGPNKGPLLGIAVAEGGALVVIDGMDELRLLQGLANPGTRGIDVLLRVNPDCVPRGMNRASATGSRRGSVFGFDYVSGEIEVALQLLADSPHLRFQGFHVHAGTGIRHGQDYREPIRRVIACAARARDFGLSTRVLDVGGGFGVPASREFNTREFLLYHGMGRLPGPPREPNFPSDQDFASALSTAITETCTGADLPLPTLVVEPGRTLVSAAGVLLLTVGAVKERPGAGTWVVTDGGAGTVAFPLFYEYHEVLLARAPRGSSRRSVNIVGSACHAADWVYRNKRMPEMEPGDVLAVCDAGAYFSVQECNFGFPRPAVVGVAGGNPRLMRRRESFEDMTARDLAWRTEPCLAQT